MTTSLADPKTFAAELAGAGELGLAYGELWRSVWDQRHLPAAVLERCFERMAVLHGLSAAQGVAASAAQSAALEFTETYLQDPAAITDSLAGAVKSHFGDAGLVALIEALGFFDARLRLARLLPLLDAPQLAAGSRS